MKSFSIGHLDLIRPEKSIATISADKLEYSGGDGVVVAVFRKTELNATGSGSEIVAVVALKLGMIVRQVEANKQAA